LNRAVWAYTAITSPVFLIGIGLKKETRLLRREWGTSQQKASRGGDMSSFDYIAEARPIRDALVGGDLSDWRTRIRGAIDTGSTGSEILMAVRWNLVELLKAEPKLPADVTGRNKEYILAANKLLG
jgi:hypothetical protein